MTFHVCSRLPGSRSGCLCLKLQAVRKTPQRSRRSLKPNYSAARPATACPHTIGGRGAIAPALARDLLRSAQTPSRSGTTQPSRTCSQHTVRTTSMDSRPVWSRGRFVPIILAARALPLQRRRHARIGSPNPASDRAASLSQKLSRCRLFGAPRANRSPRCSDTSNGWPACGCSCWRWRATALALPASSTPGRPRVACTPYRTTLDSWRWRIELA
eukprot:SAG11_NODE_3351_length_2507_cov_1.780316_1_plen_215_part_00